MIGLRQSSFAGIKSGSEKRNKQFANLTNVNNMDKCSYIITSQYA